MDTCIDDDDVPLCFIFKYSTLRFYHLPSACRSFVHRKYFANTKKNRVRTWKLTSYNSLSLSLCRFLLLQFNVIILTITVIWVYIHRTRIAIGQWNTYRDCVAFIVIIIHVIYIFAQCRTRSHSCAFAGILFFCFVHCLTSSYEIFLV